MSPFEAKSSPIEHCSINYQLRLSPGDLPTDVAVDAYYNPAITDSETALQILPGYGEERKSSIAGIEKFASLGIPSYAVILPFDKKKLPAANKEEVGRLVEKVLIEVPQRAIEKMEELMPKGARTDGFGQSQGAGALAMAASRASDAWRRVAFKDQFGVNPISPEQRAELSQAQINALIRQFGKHMLRNAIAPEQRVWEDPRNITAGFEIGRRAVIDVFQGRLKSKVGFAVTANVAPDLVDIYEAKGLEGMRIFGGIYDVVAPVSEVMTLMQREAETRGIDLARGLFKLDYGSHTPLYPNGCYDRLKRVAHFLHPEKPIVP